VLQCVLQLVAVCCIVLHNRTKVQYGRITYEYLKNKVCDAVCVTVCCSVLPYVVACKLKNKVCVAVCVTMCCSVLPCVVASQ